MTTLSLHPPIIFRCFGGLKSRLVLKVVFIVMLCLVFLLLGLYLFQAGELTRSSYLTKTYQAEIEEVASHNVNLQGESIDFLSLAKIEEKIKDLDFEKVSEVKYIPIAGDYLVKKNY